MLPFMVISKFRYNNSSFCGNRHIPALGHQCIENRKLNSGFGKDANVC